MAILAVILACHAALLVHCAVNKSICFDEGAHLGAGLAYLKYGEMSIYNLSPPVARMWVALPAYLSGAEIPPAKRHRNEPDRVRSWNYFDAVRDANLPNLHRYVLWGRFMTMPLSLCVAAIIFGWTRRLYGPAGGLIASAIWCFSPTVIAHGSTLGTDMPLTALMFLAVGLWQRFIESRRNSHALAAAVAIALAHTIKFTALLLWPMLLVLALFAIVRDRRRWRDLLAGATLAVVITFVVFNASYRFRLMGDRLGAFQFQSDTMLSVQRSLPGWLPVPFHRDAVTGFDAQKWEAESQYVTGLFGRAYFGSSWAYYPWCVISKSTIGELALLAIAVISFALKRPNRSEWPLIVLAVGTLVGMTLAARINIGIRYLLPAYPALIILLARGVQLPKLKLVIVAATTAIAIETLFATPRMHSFVNVAVRPWRWLVPDQDWGQSLLALRDWMSSQHVERIRLIGPSRLCPQPYGIPIVGAFDDSQSRFVAFSRCSLDGVPIVSPDGFILVRPWRTLRRIPPVSDLGGIVIYEIEQVKSAANREPWLAAFDGWYDAARDPALAPIDDLQARLQAGR
ncbi:hypothetical protein BH09PLA1_BH09PLA1_06890 [soil metagenome]